MKLQKFSYIAGVIIFASLRCTAPSLAYDEKQGAGLLEGGWQSLASGETWVFDRGGKWRQFVGPQQFEVDFRLIAMPANLIKIASSSGHNYIVHFSVGDTLIRVFREGDEDVPLVMQKSSN